MEEIRHQRLLQCCGGWAHTWATQAGSKVVLYPGELCSLPSFSSLCFVHAKRGGRGNRRELLKMQEADTWTAWDKEEHPFLALPSPIPIPSPALPSPFPVLSSSPAEQEGRQRAGTAISRQELGEGETCVLVIFGYKEHRKEGRAAYRNFPRWRLNPGKLPYGA